MQQIPQMGGQDIQNYARGQAVQQAFEDPMQQIMQMMQMQQMQEQAQREAMESPLQMALRQLQMEAMQQSMQQQAEMQPYDIAYRQALTENALNSGSGGMQLPPGLLPEGVAPQRGPMPQMTPQQLQQLQQPTR